MQNVSSVVTMDIIKASAWQVTKQGASSIGAEQIHEKEQELGGQVQETVTKETVEGVLTQDSGLSHQDKVHRGHIKVDQGHQAGAGECHHLGDVIGADHMTGTGYKDPRRGEDHPRGVDHLRDVDHLRGVDHLEGEITQVEVEEIPKEFNFDNNQPASHCIKVK